LDAFFATTANCVIGNRNDDKQATVKQQKGDLIIYIALAVADCARDWQLSYPCLAEEYAASNTRKYLVSIVVSMAAEPLSDHRGQVI
jgi:hypothetical protein